MRFFILKAIYKKELMDVLRDRRAFRFPRVELGGRDDGAVNSVTVRPQ